MGEEWGAREPFPFFCDFKDDLANAVREGRRKEFAEAYARHRDEVPDPLAAHTVQLATLDWNALDRPDHRARLDLTRRLLAARKSHVVPRLPQLEPGPGRAEFRGDVLLARWRFRTGETLSILANLCDRPQPRPDGVEVGEPIWGGAAPRELKPWAVHVSVGGA
jgi:maltooligosyltrehalose trehalohydrolase